MDGEEVDNGIAEEAVGHPVIQLLQVEVFASYTLFALTEVSCLRHILNHAISSWVMMIEETRP